VATLPEVAEIHVYSWQFYKIDRLESNLSQLPFTDSADTTHYRPAKPSVVSTSIVSEPIDHVCECDGLVDLLNLYLYAFSYLCLGDNYDESSSARVKRSP